MKPIYGVVCTLAVIAAVMCAGVGIHEWSYYNAHPYRTGVSGVDTVLGLGAGMGCACVAVLAWAVGRDSPQ